MGGYLKNGDVSSGHCFMNIHIVSMEKNPSSLNLTKKRDGNDPNEYEM